MSDEPVADEPAAEPASPPLLRVVHGGEPSAEELAALVVALAAMAADDPPPAASRTGWSDRRAMLRRPLDHGPGRWVASARPSI